MKYYSNINLNKNQLENAVIHVVASTTAITSPVEGQIIYDQSADIIKYYDGNKWVGANDLSLSVVGDSGSATIVNGETLRFTGGTNLTSVVTSSDEVIFNLDNSLVIASDISAPYVYAVIIEATDVYANSLYVNTIAATDVNSVNVNAYTVNATDVNSYYADFNSVNTNSIVTTDINSVFVDAHSVSTTDLFSLSADIISINADSIYATDVTSLNTNAYVINSTDLNSVTIDSHTVNATDINSVTADVHTVNATDVNSVTVDAHTINASDVNSVTVDSLTVNSNVVNATDINASTVDVNSINATDITAASFIGDTASIGPITVNSGLYPSDVSITSSLLVSEDLIVTGNISGSLASTDITGTLFSVVAGTSPAFAIASTETLTVLGTANEIEVTAESVDTVRIGIPTNPTLPGNVTITGNLTVNGSTTTVDSQTLTVRDPIIQLNTGIGDNNTNDLGLIMMRGALDSGGNVGIVWDETEDQFNLLYTNQNASDVNITPTGYAKLQTGTLVVSTDLTVGRKIISYNGSVPDNGQILIGGSTGFSRGYITGASDTGVVVTSSTDSIVVSINIDGATDGTGITVVSTDLLLLSDGGTEKRVNVSQLGSVFVRHDIGNQSLTTTDQIFARTNISAVEVVKSTFTGNGTVKTFYIPHNLGSTDVIVQIFDSTGVQVFADVDTDVSAGNYVSLTGNFASETFKVLIMGTRGTPITVTATETAP